MIHLINKPVVIILNYQFIDLMFLFCPLDHYFIILISNFHSSMK